MVGLVCGQDGPALLVEGVFTVKHIFTFGLDQHKTRDAAVVIEGCDEVQARDIMFALHGRHWCGQYSENEGERYRDAAAWAVPVQWVTVADPTD